MTQPKYVLYLVMGRVEEGSEDVEILFRMVGKVPRARVQGKFRSPAQLVDEFKIAQVTGEPMELSLQINDLEHILRPEPDDKEGPA